jgi:hypothetical protein
MDGRKPTRNADELFRLLNRASADAEWTGEELRGELRAGGIDPDQLLHIARARVEQLLNRPQQGVPGHSAGERVGGTLLPLLRELRKRTGLPAPDIAAAMGVPLAFLSAVERYPQEVPSSWRVELAARAERSLQVSGEVVMASLDTPNRLRMAAFNDSSATDATSYEGILEQAGMGEDAKRYWLSLAASG